MMNTDFWTSQKNPKDITRYLWARRGKLLPLATLLVVTITTTFFLGADAQDGGATPYTPSRGEWLSLELNVRQVLAEAPSIANEVSVRYQYNDERPNTLHIQVFYDANVSPLELQNQVNDAKQQAIGLARTKDWDHWLKLDVEKIKI